MTSDHPGLEIGEHVVYAENVVPYQAPCPACKSEAKWRSLSLKVVKKSPIQGVPDVNRTMNSLEVECPNCG